MAESTSAVVPLKPPEQLVMAAVQSRAARAWLGWSQDELASRASVSVNTVRNFESGQKRVHLNSVASMQRVVEGAGIRLLFDSSGYAAGIVRSDAAGVEFLGSMRVGRI